MGMIPEFGAPPPAFHEETVHRHPVDQEEAGHQAGPAIARPQEKWVEGAEAKRCRHKPVAAPVGHGGQEGEEIGPIDCN